MTIIDSRTETTVSRQRFGIAFSEQRLNDTKCWPVMDAGDIQLACGRQRAIVPERSVLLVSR
jgi:hypothetical protein